MRRHVAERSATKFGYLFDSLLARISDISLEFWPRVRHQSFADRKCVQRALSRSRVERSIAAQRHGTPDIAIQRRFPFFMAGRINRIQLVRHREIDCSRSTQ